MPFGPLDSVKTELLLKQIGYLLITQNFIVSRLYWQGSNMIQQWQRQPTSYHPCLTEKNEGEVNAIDYSKAGDDKPRFNRPICPYFS